MPISRAGRRSAAELAVVQIGTVCSRPEPPSELTEEQAQEWRAIVDRLLPDWFTRETHPLLVQYCRHTVSSRRISQLIANLEQSDDFDVQTYDKLLGMQERESRAMASLATKMRLTQQSTYDKKKAKGVISSRPWEDE
jgi:hypothetical protein